MHTILLVVHILSVIVWIGGGLGSAYLQPRLVSQGGTVALAWMRVAESMGPRFYGPASGLTLLSGIGLVLTTDAYSFGSFFVIFGMTVWVLLAIGTGAYAGPREKKALAAFEAGDERNGRAALRELKPFMIAEYLLLIATVIVMIYRLGG